MDPRAATNPMFGATRFKLGVFSANCDGGLTMSLAPERWRANWDDIAAMCRLADADLACSRAPHCARDYQSKISGPLFDRIDLHIGVPAVSAADRAIQSARFADTDPRIRTNAEADGALLEKVATPDEPGRKLLADAADRMKLSARGYHRVLRVARTLADLGGEEQVRRIHVAEALSYRRIAPVG
jgi:magnesium chelatase family protein